jgi:hypothetical protein
MSGHCPFKSDFCQGGGATQWTRAEAEPASILQYLMMNECEKEEGLTEVASRIFSI